MRLFLIIYILLFCSCAIAQEQNNPLATWIIVGGKGDGYGSGDDDGRPQKGGLGIKFFSDCRTELITLKMEGGFTSKSDPKAFDTTNYNSYTYVMFPYSSPTWNGKNDLVFYTDPYTDAYYIQGITRRNKNNPRDFYPRKRLKSGLNIRDQRENVILNGDSIRYNAEISGSMFVTAPDNDSLIYLFTLATVPIDTTFDRIDDTNYKNYTFNYKNINIYYNLIRLQPDGQYRVLLKSQR